MEGQDHYLVIHREAGSVLQRGNDKLDSDCHCIISNRHKRYTLVWIMFLDWDGGLKLVVNEVCCTEALACFIQYHASNCSPQAPAQSGAAPASAEVTIEQTQAEKRTSTAAGASSCQASNKSKAAKTHHLQQRRDRDVFRSQCLNSVLFSGICWCLEFLSKSLRSEISSYH